MGTPEWMLKPEGYKGVHGGQGFGYGNEKREIFLKMTIYL